MRQEEYLEFIAESNYPKFYEQGYATAGHNGPHGHNDTPVRNTAHYLIIYAYLYKKTKDIKYLDICKKFADYLCTEQKNSKSGAIKCMDSEDFDHLNGLIGQGWVIESLLYYYEVSHDNRCLETAKEIFFSQKYDYDLHMWRRIELDGHDIGIDITFNHQVWFAACSYKLAEYYSDTIIDDIIKDFLRLGAERDFCIYSSGLLQHTVNINDSSMRKNKLKKMIKLFLTPVKFLNPRKLDIKYIEYAYHIFDIYGFCILQERYGDMPFFFSEKYLKAVTYAKNIKRYDINNGVDSSIEKGTPFNVFSYSYNSPTFEYPYVAITNGFTDVIVFDSIYATQEKLMLDIQTGMFSRNNPDIETWNARTYEIIRYLEKQ